MIWRLDSTQGEPSRVTRLEQQRDDPAVQGLLLKGEVEFTRHPHRLDGTGREHDREPVAPVKGGADRVMPLLRAQDVGATEPHRNAVAPQRGGKLADKRVVRTRMGDEQLIG
jgi:hypothetical protein